MARNLRKDANYAQVFGIAITYEDFSFMTYFSNKANINTLTSLLIAYGIDNAVVCAGSRNAPIVHNLEACGSIKCHALVDERSAGFYALGLAQATQKPVVVCVTSGTALLNLAPAVAEATFQHHGIIVISADRPQAWIGQLQGQTMPQPGALTNFVGKCVNLPEPITDEQNWLCNRLINEALTEAFKPQRMSVHINVPISEPLFEFTTPLLPKERKICYFETTSPQAAQLTERLKQAKRPMIVIGQITDRKSLESFDDTLYHLYDHAVIVSEALAPVTGNCHFDEILYRIRTDENYMPDFVIHIGGDLVSKRLKAFLRQSGADVWRVGNDSEIHDTFTHLTGVVKGHPIDVLQAISSAIENDAVAPAVADFLELWANAIGDSGNHAIEYEPSYSQMLVVKEFESRLWDESDAAVHYANSNAIRLANIYSEHHVWCNRGINGIDGSVSTAAGFAAACVKDTRVFLVTGDLSFHYDQNALWNEHLGSNLRILLLNNGCGGIFKTLKGLEQSPAKTDIAGSNMATAQGICEQYGVDYFPAHNEDELSVGLEHLFVKTSEHPVLLEVFTDALADDMVYKQYFHSIVINNK